jgi:phage tail sheath gpL-like
VVASISIPGLDASDAVPGVYIYENFAAGQASGSGTVRSILVLANKTASGTATPDTVIYGPDTDVSIQTESDMITLSGAGSEAHRMFRRITAINNSTSVYWLFVTASAGTAASGTVTIATTATGTGSHRLWVGDEFVDTSIATGDTPTVIAAAIKANVNAKTHWAVTADNVAGVLTLTAKNAGPRGNWIRFMAAITAGIGSTTTATADAFLTSGATADSNTTALTTIIGKSFYRIVSAAEDATQLGALVSQVNTQALPITGIRQRVFAGSVDTLANATSVATGINAVRAEICWSEKSPWTPSELAANMAAAVSLYETAPNPRTNFAGFGGDANTQASWKVPKSRTDSAAPTRTQLRSALNNGLSPVKVESNGATTLCNRITTRSLSGSTPDYRIRDSHKVTICDFFSDDLGTKTVLQYSGLRIADNPPKGSPPPPQSVTPDDYRSCILGLIQSYDDNGLLQNVPTVKANTVVQRETSPSTRMTARIPLATVDNAFQFGIEVAQVA